MQINRVIEGGLERILSLLIFVILQQKNSDFIDIFITLILFEAIEKLNC